MSVQPHPTDRSANHATTGLNLFRLARLMGSYTKNLRVLTVYDVVRPQRCGPACLQCPFPTSILSDARSKVTNQGCLVNAVSLAQNLVDSQSG